MRPGSAAPAPPLLPLRSSRPPPHWELGAARPREAGAGREGLRSPPPASSAVPSQGNSPPPPPPPPPRLPPGHRQPSWRRADAEPLPRGRHRGRSPSPRRLQRPWGASGAGPALAPPRPAHEREAPPPSGGDCDSEAARCGRTLRRSAAPHSGSPPTGLLLRFPVKSAPPPPLRLFRTLSHLWSLPPLALRPSLPTERSVG